MRIPFVIAFLSVSLCAFAQTSFESINQTASPHVTGLGGEVITSTRYVPSLYLENPALLSDTILNFLSAGYMYHPAGVNHGFAGMVTNIPKAGPVGITFRRVGYGKVDSYDETGQYLGVYESNENMIGLTKSWISGNFVAGTSLKWISSNFAGFRANAMMLDVGGLFIHPEKELTFGLVVSNVGIIINDYTNTSDSQLPLEIRAGATYKPQFMPFRFTGTVYNIGLEPSVIFEDPETSNFEKTVSYLNLGVELILSENLQLLGGYNFRKRYELRLQNGVYGAGLSAGIRFQKKDLMFEYGFARQSAAGTINHVVFTMNMNKILGLNRKAND